MKHSPEPWKLCHEEYEISENDFGNEVLIRDANDLLVCVVLNEDDEVNEVNGHILRASPLLYKSAKRAMFLVSVMPGPDALEIYRELEAALKEVEKV